MKALNIPVIEMGDIVLLEDANQLIVSGNTDMITVVREGLVSDKLFLSGQKVCMWISKNQ